MGDIVVKTTVEFIVRGKETYYVLLDFGKTRSKVIDVVKKVTTDMITKVSTLPTESGDLTVKLIFKTTREQPVKAELKNVSAKTAFEIEYMLVEAQKLMLDEVAKL